MAIVLEVTLISGRRASVEADPDASVESFKQQARAALGVSKGRLLTSSGTVLDGICRTAKREMAYPCRSALFRRMCNRSKLLSQLLPPSWVMDQSSLGAMPTMVAAAVLCKTS